MTATPLLSPELLTAQLKAAKQRKGEIARQFKTLSPGSQASRRPRCHAGHYSGAQSHRGTACRQNPPSQTDAAPKPASTPALTLIDPAALHSSL